MSGLARRFGAAWSRADQAFVARIGADRRRQYARDRRDRAVEPEFAKHGKAGKRVRRNGADCRHQAERDRQVVMAAFLRKIGGREIDGDTPRRQREPRGDQRRAHALARFRHRLVGKPDDGEGRQARRDLDLHVDGSRFDALKRDCGNPLDHVPSAIQGSGAGGHEQEHSGNIRSVSPGYLRPVRS